MPSAYDYNQKYEESSISESKNIKSEEESTVKDKSSKDYLDVDFSISSDEETEQFNHKSMLKKSKTQYAPKENKMREYHFKRDRVESDDSVAEKFSSNKRLLPPLAKRNNLKSNFDYSDLDQAYDIEKEPKTTKAAQRKGSGLFKAKIDKNIKLQREPEEWEMPDYEKSYYVNADHFYIKKAYVVDSVCKLKGSQADYDKWKLKSMKRSLKFDAEFDKFLIFTMFKRRVFEIPTNPSMYIPSDKRIEQSMLRKNLKAYYSASTSDNQELNEDKSPKTDKNGSIYTPIEIKSHMNDRAKMILLSLDFTMVEFWDILFKFLSQLDKNQIGTVTDSELAAILHRFSGEDLLGISKTKTLLDWIEVKLSKEKIIKLDPKFKDNRRFRNKVFSKIFSKFQFKNDAEEVSFNVISPLIFLLLLWKECKEIDKCTKVYSKYHNKLKGLFVKHGLSQLILLLLFLILFLDENNLTEQNITYRMVEKVLSEPQNLSQDGLTYKQIDQILKSVKKRMSVNYVINK